jgi:hypothetical protein
MLAADSVAHRLASGRTATNLLLTMGISLMGSLPEGEISQTIVPPVRGLSAKWKSQRVWILDTFTRIGCAKCDVASLVSDGTDGSFKISYVFACNARELYAVAFQHQVTEIIAGSQQVKLKEIKDMTSLNVAKVLEDAKLAAAALKPRVQPNVKFSPSNFVLSGCPAAAKKHQDEHPIHVVRPRTDRARFAFCLDIPIPKVWDSTPWRCRICNIDGNWYPGEADFRIWSRECGTDDHIVYKNDRHGKVRVTPSMMLWLLATFYADMNVRSLRRHLLNLYSATTLYVARANPCLTDAAQLRWILSSVPNPRILKGVLLHVFRDYVQARVDVMRKHQFIYNGQLLRGDGNYKLAKRVRVSPDDSGERLLNYTVVLAWCGVDGSLLSPVSLAKAESWNCLSADLEPLLVELKAARMAYGLSLHCSLPCFHATDSFHKHRALILKLYDKIWSEFRVETNASTPCSDPSLRARIKKRDRSQLATLFRVTGEPMHDLYALRRLAKPAANDCVNFLSDHQDMILRLSAAPSGEEDVQAAACFQDVSPVCQELLQCYVQRPRQEFVQKLESSDEMVDFKSFVSAENVQDHPVWRDLFEAQPPRGVLARLARQCKCTLHHNFRFSNYRKACHFKEEVERMQEWYCRPKKQCKARKGIFRGDATPLRVKGRAKVFSSKVRAHYHRLKGRVRQFGMLRWRSAALALHTAGISVHSGTVPVERLWANIGDFFPKSATRMSADWFAFTANLAFLRFNYRHFHKVGLPPWALDDVLLHERMESSLHTAQMLLLENTAAGDLAQTLFKGVKSHEDSDVEQEEKREASQEEELEQVTSGKRSFTFSYCRRLELLWSNALAEGLKFFETQRSQKHSHNIFKFAEKGGRFFFGATGKGNDTVAGLAEASGAVFIYCRFLFCGGDGFGRGVAFLFINSAFNVFVCFRRVHIS